jgi:hypothetical protein
LSHVEHSIHNQKGALALFQYTLGSSFNTRHLALQVGELPQSKLKQRFTTIDSLNAEIPQVLRVFFAIEHESVC